MPYALRLKSPHYPVAKLRDGVGFSAPVRILSELYEVAFDTLPAVAAGDPNILWREVSQSEALQIQVDMEDNILAAEATYAKNRAAAQAKMDRLAAAGKAAQVAAQAAPGKPRPMTGRP